VVLALAASTAASADRLELAAGGAFMANLHNELRVGASDVELAWRHDFSWSSLHVGAEWLSFFLTQKADPAVGLRLGFSVRREAGPVTLSAGLGLGAYVTHASPVLPIGALDLGVERRMGDWALGAAVSGLYSLFGAGVQGRLVVGRCF
jgi:hypothetical protein